jgi:hypothetical protein
MFAYILEKLSGFFEHSEQHRMEKYLARSVDLDEIERHQRRLVKADIPARRK